MEKPMEENNLVIPVETLVAFMERALQAFDIPPEDAKIIADVLITSDLWGVRSHGIAHLAMYYKRIKKRLALPQTQWRIEKETQTTAVIDGGNGMGMVVGYHAMNMAIQKAQEYGLPYHVNENFAVAVWQHIKMLKMLGVARIIPS